MENDFNEFEISFNDLTPECQKRLLEFLKVETPEEADYDHVAVAVVQYGESDEGDESPSAGEDEMGGVFVVNRYHTA